jgi:hypothetical protein
MSSCSSPLSSAPPSVSDELVTTKRKNPWQTVMIGKRRKVEAEAIPSAGDASTDVLRPRPSMRGPPVAPPVWAEVSSARGGRHVRLC